MFPKGRDIVDEFELLFASLFNNHEIYIKLIRLIAKSRSGVSQAEIINAKGLSSGGRAIQKLKQLEQAGFILSFIPYGHQQRGIYYKIID